MASTSGSTGLDTFLAPLLRRKWLALSVFSLVLAAAISFAKALPSLYQSTATVLVERPAQNDTSDDVDSRLQSIRQEILSRTRLAQLIGRFDLYPKLRAVASQDVVVQQMRRDIRIDASGAELHSGRGTIAFSLSYRGRDPQKVTVVANALANSYIEEDSQQRDRQTKGVASVLQVQLEEVKGRLAQQESRIADFKKKHPGALPQQADNSLLAVERFSAQAQRVSEARAAAIERRAALLRDGGGPDSAGPPDPDRARLDRLNQELVELRTRFSDKYPDVVNKKAEVESLAAVVATKPQVDRSLPQLEQANREIRTLQAEEARLRGQTASYQQRAQGAPWLEQEYQALSRDYGTTRDFYDSLLKRYEEAQLAEAQEGSPRGQRLRLLDPAITPVDPLAPDRLRLAIFGLIAAFGLGIFSVLAAEKLDTSFHSAEELSKHTRVPILVRIPRMSTETPADRTRARSRAALLTVGLVLAVAFTASVSRILARENEAVVGLLAPRGRS